MESNPQNLYTLKEIIDKALSGLLDRNQRIKNIKVNSETKPTKTYESVNTYVDTEKVSAYINEIIVDELAGYGLINPENEFFLRPGTVLKTSVGRKPVIKHMMQVINMGTILESTFNIAKLVSESNVSLSDIKSVETIGCRTVGVKNEVSIRFRYENTCIVIDFTLKDNNKGLSLLVNVDIVPERDMVPMGYIGYSNGDYIVATPEDIMFNYTYNHKEGLCNRSDWDKNSDTQYLTVTLYKKSKTEKSIVISGVGNSVNKFLNEVTGVPGDYETGGREVSREIKVQHDKVLEKFKKLKKKMIKSCMDAHLTSIEKIDSKHNSIYIELIELIQQAINKELEYNASHNNNNSGMPKWR